MTKQDISNLKKFTPAYPKILLMESGMCYEETPDKPFKRVFTYMTLVRLYIDGFYYLYLIRVDEEQGENKDLLSINKTLIGIHQQVLDAINSNSYEEYMIMDEDQESDYVSEFSFAPFERGLIELGAVKNMRQ